MRKAKTGNTCCDSIGHSVVPRRQVPNILSPDTLFFYVFLQ